MKTAKNLLIFASILFGYYSIFSAEFIASSDDFIYAVVADRSEYFLPYLCGAIAFLLTGIALLTARLQSRSVNGNKSTSPIFAVSLIAMAVLTLLAGIIFSVEDYEEEVMIFYIMLYVASSIMMVIGSFMLTISTRGYWWVLKVLAVVSSVAFLIYNLRLPLVWSYIEDSNYIDAYGYFTREGATLFDTITVITFIGNLLWLIFLVGSAVQYYKLSNAESYGLCSQHGTQEPTTSVEQQGVVPQEAEGVNEASDTTPCSRSESLCDAVGLMADKSRKVLKIIFNTVAVLVGISALGLVIQLCFYAVIANGTEADFESYLTYINIYGMAKIIINILSYMLIAGGFYIMGSVCKSVKSVNIGSKILSISALLTLLLIVLQFFELTHNQNYNVWTRTVYIVDLACCGYILFSIVNLVGFSYLLSAQQKSLLKSFAMLYPISMIIHHCIMVALILDMVLNLGLGLSFRSDTFSWVYFVTWFFATIFWSIFCFLFARLFSQKANVLVEKSNE